MDIAISSSLTMFKPMEFSSRRSLQTRSKTKTISCSVTRSNTVSETNFYKLLSLDSEKAGFDEIKKAYRNKALRCHPDVCPPSRKEEFTWMFVELRKAYETLSDPISRRKYDCELGLCKAADTYMGATRSEFSRATWEDQLAQLRMRSDRRMKQKKGSSSSRMRSQQM
ncbi:chaperone protein dnaJ 20, chloroplastic-like [Magnolia sinica]|uniref:chaperone protein dnaJ 20, chloroplastic-like n=1 Tax=Magnolia sinica TaxID=86752 RepID=UPI0026587835|nr:chaperone protein dnaJ 20, chloroplastic-like [Magnolia sinica]